MFVLIIKVGIFYHVYYFKVIFFFLIFLNMLHQIKTPQFYTNFLKLISLVMDSSISDVEF